MLNDEKGLVLGGQRTLYRFRCNNLYNTQNSTLHTTNNTVNMSTFSPTTPSQSCNRVVYFNVLVPCAEISKLLIPKQKMEKFPVLLSDTVLKHLVEWGLVDS